MLNKSVFNCVVSAVSVSAFLIACGPVNSTNSLAEDGETRSDKTYSTYFEAHSAAEEEGKDLFIYFRQEEPSGAKKVFEDETLVSDSIRKKLSGYVLAVVPVDHEIDVDEKPTRIVDHSVFKKLGGMHGFAILSLSKPDSADHNRVISCYPFIHLGGPDAHEEEQNFKPFEPWKAETLEAILSLPDGSPAERERALASHEISRGTIFDLVPNPDGVELSANEREVVRLTNMNRKNHGLRILAVKLILMQGSRRHSGWMAGSGSLTHGNGVFSGENIAMGYGSPAAALDGWMTSSGHRANILSAGFSTIGVGDVSNWWTQRFGR